MKVGLFFGSFNPVHVGHMIIANYMANATDLDQVWMVVSPHNPLKEKKTLAGDYDRLHLVHLAIGENSQIRASDIEFSLPKPSYTIDTLTYLKEKFPDHDFVLIMGGDNLANFHRWKNFNEILKNYKIYLYKRPSQEKSRFDDHPQIKYFDAPLLEISASYIRSLIREGKSIQYLVPDEVYKYLEGSNMYQQ